MRVPRLAAGLILAGLLSTPVPAQAPVDNRPEKRIGVKTDVPGALHIDEPFVLLGAVHQGASLEHRFSFTNRGPGAVLIEEGIALSGTGQVEFHPARVAPGAAGEVLVRQPVAERLGRVAFRFALVTDEPGVSRYRLGVTSFVESAYDPELPLLDFGVVDKGATRSAEAEVFSREVASLQVLAVADVPAFLRVEASARTGLAGEGVRLRATLDGAAAPLGVTRGSLRLRTNVEAQPDCLVGYSLNVVGDVMTSVDVLGLGLVRQGETAAAELTLVSRSGRPLEVTAVEDLDRLVTARALPCAADKAGPGCRRIRVEHAGGAKGPFSGRLLIRLAGQAEPLRVRYSGIVIGPDTRIKEMDLAQEPAESELLSRAPAPGGPPPAPAPSPAAPGPETGEPAATLRWTVRREADVYGYIVYRSEQASGPFVRVSPEIVQARPGAEDERRAYSFVDRDVEPGRTYYYYLDTVDVGGHKHRFSEARPRRIPDAP